MKVYIVLENRGYDGVFRGVWTDRTDARQYTKKYYPHNGKIIVFDTDKYTINVELPIYD